MTHTSTSARRRKFAATAGLALLGAALLVAAPITAANAADADLTWEGTTLPQDEWVLDVDTTASQSSETFRPGEQVQFVASAVYNGPVPTTAGMWKFSWGESDYGSVSCDAGNSQQQWNYVRVWNVALSEKTEPVNSFTCTARYTPTDEDVARGYFTIGAFFGDAQATPAFNVAYAAAFGEDLPATTFGSTLKKTFVLEGADPASLPSIATVLTDTRDGDKTLAYNGGWATDTVAYENLTPGVPHTIAGELLNKDTYMQTGISDVRSFTPTSASGTVQVRFLVPDNLQGANLAAFEVITANVDGADRVIAQHRDVNDPEQTVLIGTQQGSDPAIPVIWTSLADSTDRDQIVTEGGTAVDTVSYRNLQAGPDDAPYEYVITGQLYDEATGEPTGITGETRFTVTNPSATGKADVTFDIPEGFAGKKLVAFQTVTLNGEFAADHNDLGSVAQTITVAAGNPVDPVDPTNPPVDPTNPPTEPTTDPTDPIINPRTPVTGQVTAEALATTGGTPPLFAGIAGGVALMLGASLILFRRRGRIRTTTTEEA